MLPWTTPSSGVAIAISQRSRMSSVIRSTATRGVSTVARASTAVTNQPPSTISKSKKKLQLAVEGDSLQSTPEQRAWVIGAQVAMGLTVVEGFHTCHEAGPLSLAAGVAAVAGAYVLSDLGTGIYHWYVDNYGDENTPIFGRQIAAFQGHHRQPWTITEREFCNNVYLVFRPVAPLAGAVLLASPFLDGSTDVFLGCFAWFVCMSQQFHAWSHMKKSQLPSPIVYLQEKGLLISRKMHGAHHLAPFEGNYCIVSGLWNPVLDQEGDENNFFRSLERIVHQITGHEPRCWSDPEDWHEVAYDGPNASVSESMDQDLS